MYAFLYFALCARGWASLARAVRRATRPNPPSHRRVGVWMRVPRTPQVFTAAQLQVVLLARALGCSSLASTCVCGWESHGRQKMPRAPRLAVGAWGGGGSSFGRDCVLALPVGGGVVRTVFVVRRCFVSLLLSVCCVVRRAAPAAVVVGWGGARIRGLCLFRRCFLLPRRRSFSTVCAVAHTQRPPSRVFSSGAVGLGSRRAASRVGACVVSHARERFLSPHSSPRHSCHRRSSVVRVVVRVVARARVCLSLAVARVFVSVGLVALRARCRACCVVGFI